MPSLTKRRVAASSIAFLLGAVACGGSTAPDKPDTTGLRAASCPGVNLGPRPATLSLPQSNPATLQVLGTGAETARYTAEIAVRGSIAYTTTWGFRAAIGNKVNVWDVSGNT